MTSSISTPALQLQRLQDTFKGEPKPYEIIGQPQDLESAKALALESEHDGRYQFEWWALGLVDARPAQDKKKGADSGIDGYINFFDDNSGKAKRIVAQIKGGNATRNQIATLTRATWSAKKRKSACSSPSKPQPVGWSPKPLPPGSTPREHYPDSHYPRIQILTIEELLAGKRAEYPRLAPEATFRRAPPRQRSVGAQAELV